MTTEQLSATAYDRLLAEQKSFRDWLLKQPAEEVLNHAYEYAMREDIVYAMEDLELSESQALALLGSETPLSNIYKTYLNVETDHMEVIQNCIEHFVNDAEKLFTGIREQPIYRHSFDYAVAHGEEKQYRDSYHANVACKEAIEKSIAQNYANNCMDAVASKQVVTQFGFDRTLYVLANTVQLKDWDARFSRNNKTWASTIQIAGGDDSMRDYRWKFVVDKSHPGLTDMFLTMVRSDLELQNKQRASIREKLKVQPQKNSSNNSANFSKGRER